MPKSFGLQGGANASDDSNRDKKLMKHEPLTPKELPRPGTVVAIDAEFVQMQQVRSVSLHCNLILMVLQEEVEYHTDGTRKVILPARLSLARVSVLREGGDKEGKPFIDDYIHTTEAIVDYLTEFSGIQRTFYPDTPANLD